LHYRKKIAPLRIPSEFVIYLPLSLQYKEGK
jgi:hypothetical protein